jgi:hypothetical protein
VIALPQSPFPWDGMGDGAKRRGRLSFIERDDSARDSRRETARRMSA